MSGSSGTSSSSGSPRPGRDRAVRPVGILSVGVGAPTLRLPIAEARAAWGGGSGRGNVGVCGSDEDSLTLAWEASDSALRSFGDAVAGGGASEIDGLWWGSSRPPFAEGPNFSFLSSALGLDPEIAGALHSGSPHAGMEALLGAWDAIAAGHIERALVVVSDALIPGLGTASETTYGAGAAALVLGEAFGAPAVLRSRATRSVPVLDRYRADGAFASGDPYDPRLFREQVYLPLMADAAAAAVAHSGGESATPSVSAWSLSDPDGKLSSTLAKRLGSPAPLSSPVQSELGDTGAASALLGLAPSLAEAGSVGAVGYGGGRATAVSVEVDHPVPGADGFMDRLGIGYPTTYMKAAVARGLIEAMVDPVPMGLPPGGAAFVRGNPEMLGFLGARCKTCGTISTPPSVHPACIACGGFELENVPLSRRGIVQTFVVNQTMPPPFVAPLPLVVLDLEDGARLMVQGTPQDAPQIRIGDQMRLVLRRYALERGVPVYGFKAVRQEVAESVGEVSK